MKQTTKNTPSDDDKAQEESERLDRAIGERIRAARKISRVTQSVLGERIGVTYQQLQKYECGKNKITVPRLIKISTALGTPLSFFTDGLADVGAASEQEGPKDGDITSETRFLIEMFAMLMRESDRKMVVDLIYYLVDRQNSRRRASAKPAWRLQDV